MEPTLDTLTASAAPGCGSHREKAATQRPSKARGIPESSPDVVDLGDDNNGDSDTVTPPSQPRKRTHSAMEEDWGVFHDPRQFKRVHRKSAAEQSRRPAQPDRHKTNPGRTSNLSSCPPPQPLRVAPIQSRSPSPERVAILGPETPVPNVPGAAPISSETPIPHNENSAGEVDVAAKLRKDRQAFYLKATNAARMEVKMDTAKPPLMPPLAPPGLFHLLQCGFLKFDVHKGSFPDFQEEVDNWRHDPACMDKLWAAYGKFHSPLHQVCAFFDPTELPFHCQFCSMFCVCNVISDIVAFTGCNFSLPFRNLFRLCNVCPCLVAG